MQGANQRVEALKCWGGEGTQALWLEKVGGEKKGSTPSLPCTHPDKRISGHSSLVSFFLSALDTKILQGYVPHLPHPETHAALGRQSSAHMFIIVTAAGPCAL